MNSQQGMFTALFSEIEPTKLLKDYISYPDANRPTNFDILDSLNLSETNMINETSALNDSDIIENSNLINEPNPLNESNIINGQNTTNEQLPTPLTSFIETIYPSSYKSNKARHEITPIVDLPGSQLPNSGISVNKVKAEIKTTKFKRNFQEEAESLTRRIVSGKLRSIKNNTDSRKELFVRKDISSVSDLSKKKLTPVPEKKHITREQRIENIIQDTGSSDDASNKIFPPKITVDHREINTGGNAKISPWNNTDKALVTPTDTRFDKNDSFETNLQSESFFEQQLYFSNDSNVLESTASDVLSPEFFNRYTPNLSTVLNSFAATSPTALVNTSNTMENLPTNSNNTSPNEINSSLNSLHAIPTSIDNFSPALNMPSSNETISSDDSYSPHDMQTSTQEMQTSTQEMQTSTQEMQISTQENLKYDVIGNSDNDVVDINSKYEQFRASAKAIDEIAHLLHRTENISDHSHYDGEQNSYTYNEDNSNYYDNEGNGSSHEFSMLDNRNGLLPTLVQENSDLSQFGIAKSVSSNLTLVEQLQADKPLLNAVHKKQKRGSYRCAHCPETFSNIMEYAEHMDIFNIKREYKCPFPLCAWKILGLPRRSDLRRHCAIQHKTELRSDLKQLLNLKDETYPIIQCDNVFCEKEFYRKDAYNRHIAIVHDNKKSRFNKKLNFLLKACPKDATEKEKYDFVKANIFKKKMRKKSQKDQNVD